MHKFRPLASYRYNTALVGPDKLASPPAAPRLEDLIKDKDPGYYIYQMSFADLTGKRRQVEGIFGILELDLDEPPHPTLNIKTTNLVRHEHIFAHEQTITSGTEVPSDTIDPLVVRPGTGPIWGISVQNMLKVQTTHKNPLLASVKDYDGVVHQVWQITDSSEKQRIATAIDTSQIIIADGHHRFARSLKKLSMSPPGTIVRLLCFLTDLSTLQAEIRPIHRCFKTRLENTEVLDRLRKHFIVVPYDRPSIGIYQDLDSLLILLGTLVLKVKPQEGAGYANDAILSQAIARLLEARSTQYITDIDKLREKVKMDRTKIGIVTRPVTIDQIRVAALNDMPLPPKSTMFYPKPLSGLILGDRLNI
ncbi:MAG: DUF1015 family protein [Acidimicrobiaceae bacterium]|nr:DUF1015 family protein [Acidimicrobiaceae bacterium]